MAKQKPEVSLAELARIELQQAELEAWKDVCKELKSLGVEINAQDTLCKLLAKWGDSFAVLRRELYWNRGREGR